MEPQKLTVPPRATPRCSGAAHNSESPGTRASRDPTSRRVAAEGSGPPTSRSRGGAGTRELAPRTRRWGELISRPPTYTPGLGGQACAALVAALPRSGRPACRGGPPGQRRRGWAEWPLRAGVLTCCCFLGRPRPRFCGAGAAGCPWAEVDGCPAPSPRALILASRRRYRCLRRYRRLQPLALRRPGSAQHLSGVGGDGNEEGWRRQGRRELAELARAEGCCCLGCRRCHHQHRTSSGCQKEREGRRRGGGGEEKEEALRAVGGGGGGGGGGSERRREAAREREN